MLNELPIIGLPYAIKGWFLTLNLVCNCDAKEPIMVVGSLGAVAKCPACNRVFQVQGAQSDAANNRMSFQIAVGMAAPTPALTAQ